MIQFYKNRFAEIGEEESLLVRLFLSSTIIVGSILFLALAGLIIRAMTCEPVVFAIGSIVIISTILLAVLSRRKVLKDREE